MRSIQHKFVVLSLLGILLCTIAVGGLGLISTARAQAEASNEVLELSCLKEANRLNQELLHIEGAVGSCADFVRASVSSVSQLANEEWRTTFLAQMQGLEGSIAANTRGVCTYYLHLAPELSSADAGYFYAATQPGMQMVRQELTDVTAYDEDDTADAGWYYLPRAAGAPIWMEPYNNEAIDVNMVSYVVPLYVDRTFIGVVGMDVDFNVIADIARNIKPYESSTACLVSYDGSIYFHPAYGRGAKITEVASIPQSLVDELPTLATGQSGAIVTYKSGGVEKKLTYCGLRNNMVLLLSADTSEINEPVYHLLNTVALVGCLMSVVVAAVMIKATQRITKPLEQLAKVADEIASGNLDVELPEAGNDEVGALARSLDFTVRNLRTYISGISAKAYQDSLTLVRNKAAYVEAVELLEKSMAEGEETPFAVLMIDVNNLKLVNDQHGHDHGDEYLKGCCQLLCDVFQHSPVFRIGGDEFVVILEGDDFVRRHVLLDEFDARMEASLSSPNAWERYSMAKGMAEREKDDASYFNVFKRADQIMYENKRKMKGEGAVR